VFNLSDNTEETGAEQDGHDFALRRKDVA
jgi:hypothetical protein